MKSKDAPSALATAVEALELELLQLDRLTEQALRHPLNSEKHIQSTASSLQAIGGMEERLRACMEALLSALNGVGARQQEQMERASERADELKERHGVFSRLMERYGALGQSAGELQQLLQGLSNEDDGATQLPIVMEKLASLVAESEALEAASEQEGFIDLVRHARSLRQQLSSAHSALLRRIGKTDTAGPPQEAPH